MVDVVVLEEYTVFVVSNVHLIVAGVVTKVQFVEKSHLEVSHPSPVRTPGGVHTGGKAHARGGFSKVAHISAAFCSVHVGFASLVKILGDADKTDEARTIAPINFILR